MTTLSQQLNKTSELPKKLTRNGAYSQKSINLPEVKKCDIRSLRYKKSAMHKELFPTQKHKQEAMNLGDCAVYQTAIRSCFVKNLGGYPRQHRWYEQGMKARKGLASTGNMLLGVAMSEVKLASNRCRNWAESHYRCQHTSPRIFIP